MFNAKNMEHVFVCEWNWCVNCYQNQKEWWQKLVKLASLQILKIKLIYHILKYNRRREIQTNIRQIWQDWKTLHYVPWSYSVHIPHTYHLVSKADSPPIHTHSNFRQLVKTAITTELNVIKPNQSTVSQTCCECESELYRWRSFSRASNSKGISSPGSTSVHWLTLWVSSVPGPWTSEMESALLLCDSATLWGIYEKLYTLMLITVYQELFGSTTTVLSLR